jgi:ribonuclease BN (tRNA processing enzyme)
MKLTVIGSSPAWPNSGGAHAGYLVGAPGATLLDCGPGVLARLRERDGWPEISAIVITHFHLDHWGDLVPWAWGSFYRQGRGDASSPPELWLPPDGRRQLTQFGSLLGFPDMFERAFEVQEFSPDVPFETGAHSVVATQVPHYQLEAYALKVSDGERTLVYSGDCGPSVALGTLARDADLFLCEATLSSGELDGEPRGHLSLSEAVAIFESSGAKRLLVTHRPEELETEAVELAHDGLVIDL